MPIFPNNESRRMQEILTSTYQVAIKNLRSSGLQVSPFHLVLDEKDVSQASESTKTKIGHNDSTSSIPQSTKNKRNKKKGDGRIDSFKAKINLLVEPIVVDLD